MKVMVSIPDDLLARIDAGAAERGESRSAFLQEAARMRLGEPNHRAARRLVARRNAREVEMRILDLTLYEIGNVIVRAWREPRELADGFVARVTTIANGPPLVPTAAERREAHRLAEEHRLSVYDATYAAVAQERRLTLVSGDRALVRAGLATTPADV